MKYKLIIKLVIFVLKIKSINCSEPPPPWFMYDKYLYYVDSQQKFTSNYTQKECMKLEMIATISQANAEELLPHLRQVYGDFPALWTYNNEYFNNVLNTYIQVRTCFKLDANSMEFKPKTCSEKLGFICKTRMKSAVIFSQDSNLWIKNDNIKKYCDPHANIINGAINSCLINL